MSEQKGTNPSGATDSASGGSGSPTGGLGAEASERARATLDHAREDARALVERARETARSALDRQKSEAVSQLQGLSQAMRSAADSLEQQHQGPVARYAGLAAESLGDMAEALDDQDLQTLLRGAKRLARRQPALFVGGAVALGFGLARFLKTSGEGVEQEPQNSAEPVSANAPPAPAPRSSGAAKPRGRSRSRGPGAAGQGQGAAGAV